MQLSTGEYLFNFMFGDVSFDGHASTETFTLLCNKSMEKFLLAFEKIHTQLGIDFTKILSGYEDNEIPPYVLNLLEQHTPFTREVLETAYFDTSPTGKVYVHDTRLFMQFLLDLVHYLDNTLTVTIAYLPTIKKQIGYGLFVEF